MKNLLLTFLFAVLISFYLKSQNRTTQDSLQNDTNYFEIQTRSLPQSHQKELQINKSSINYTNSIFIDVKLENNKKGKFILDTGSPITLLDKQFVSQNSVKLDSISQIEVGGAGNSGLKKMTLYNPINVKLLNIATKSNYVLIYELKKLIPIEDGIIGADFFYDKIVEINFNQNKIKIHKNKSSVNENFKKIPITVKDDGKFYIYLDLQITDSISAKGLFMIDTGSEFAISLNRYYSDSLNLFDKIDKKILKQVKNGGIGGDTYKFLIKAKHVKISKFILDNILISCSKQKHGASVMTNNQRVGTIGNLFLQNFDIVFNIPEKELYLKPNSNFTKGFVYYGAGGMSIGKKTEQGYTIRNVLEKSSAYKNDVKENDILVKINDTNVLEIGYIKLKETLRTPGDYNIEILRNGKILNKTITVENLMKHL